MSSDQSLEFHIPSEYVYDGMVMQGELYPKEGLDRIKLLDLFPEDVLITSYCKTGE